MAVKAVTSDVVADPGCESQRAARLYTWAALTENDEGKAVNASSFPYQCGQLVGTWGGGTIQWQGSNDYDGSSDQTATGNWFPLLDESGNTAEGTEDSMRQVIRLPRWIKPKATAGSSMSVVPTLFCVSHVGR